MRHLDSVKKFICTTCFNPQLGPLQVQIAAYKSTTFFNFKDHGNINSANVSQKNARSKSKNAKNTLQDRDNTDSRY
jgi:hypothetical protein